MRFVRFGLERDPSPSFAIARWRYPRVTSQKMTLQPVKRELSLMRSAHKVLALDAALVCDHGEFRDDELLQVREAFWDARGDG